MKRPFFLLLLKTILASVYVSKHCVRPLENGKWKLASLRRGEGGGSLAQCLMLYFFNLFDTVASLASDPRPVNLEFICLTFYSRKDIIACERLRDVCLIVLSLPRPLSV